MSIQYTISIAHVQSVYHLSCLRPVRIPPKCPCPLRIPSLLPLSSQIIAHSTHVHSTQSLLPMSSHLPYTCPASTQSCHPCPVSTLSCTHICSVRIPPLPSITTSQNSTSSTHIQSVHYFSCLHPVSTQSSTHFMSKYHLSSQLLVRILPLLTMSSHYIMQLACLSMSAYHINANVQTEYHFSYSCPV